MRKCVICVAIKMHNGHEKLPAFTESPPFDLLSLDTLPFEVLLCLFKAHQTLDTDTEACRVLQTQYYPAKIDISEY